MKKRSSWDFSSYEHRVEIFTNEKGGQIRVDHLQKGNSLSGYLKFINTDDRMFVSGDFGDWSFARPFIPTKDGSVSEIYWLEKMHTYSTQVVSEFDPDTAREEIEHIRKEETDEFNNGVGYEEDDYNELMSFLDELEHNSDDELDYLFTAYRGDTPDCYDAEDLPEGTRTNPRVLIIFDAFEEICSRM